MVMACIVITYISRSSFLLMDEPLACQDAPHQARIVQSCVALARTHGRTIVFVTSALNHARSFDKLAVMRKGVVVESNSKYIGHNYIGHNYIGHNYIDHNYIGHNYIGHNYIGHNHIGHNYIAMACSAMALYIYGLYSYGRRAVQTQCISSTIVSARPFDGGCVPRMHVVPLSLIHI